MTRPIDEAIRAACSRWHDQDCTYPSCDCAPVVPDMIRAARDVFFAETSENVEAAERGLARLHPWVNFREEAVFALAGLRARWGDEG